MSKKVSELTKELDITLQELRDYAAKMSIEIKDAGSSVDDVAAERLVRSISMLRGNAGSGKSGGNKPKIKAVPVMPKDKAKAKPPAG